VDLDLRPSHLAGHDVIGDVYQYLIERFAAGAGKKAGEFFTPPEVSMLLSRCWLRSLVTGSAIPPVDPALYSSKSAARSVPTTSPGGPGIKWQYVGAVQDEHVPA